MATVAAAGAKAQLAEGKVDSIADDQQIRARQLVKLQHLPHRAAAQVHERLGLDEQHPPGILAELAQLSLEASGKLAGVRTLHQGVDHGIADIMPRTGIT